MHEQIEKKPRKKASRACFHCQKAHLTCDDDRPCQRCLKRGLASTCTDGIKKKAKYLQEDERRMHLSKVGSMLPMMDDTLHWLDQKGIVLNNIHSANTSPRKIRRRKSPKEIYSCVVEPYNYAESYHALIEFVKRRMGREELIRISRAIVLFRPSYMSIVASLTEEDLVVMEKCVQRALLEFEKLISFSGTPTAVWRRTGEIVLVGKEFLLLTQWSKETLLGKKTFIYELMNNGSVVEYWEKFSQHAFSHAESAVTMSVILMSPTSRPVPCSFCFTLKRDIFDIPSIVVGNFLPILGTAS